MVGFDRRQWAVNRRANWDRYRAAITRLDDLADVADVGAGENGTFSAERVLALQPDLLIKLALDDRGLPKQMAQIEAAGVPVVLVDYNAQVFDKHVASTRALGLATGNVEWAGALVDLYTERTADIARRVAGAERPLAYVELGQGGASSGSSSCSVCGRAC